MIVERMSAGPSAFRRRASRIGIRSSVVLLFLLGAPAAFGSEKVFVLDVPPQSLASAMDALQAQTDSHIVYSPSQFGTLGTSGLSGRYTVGSALRKLLAGSGLIAKRDDRGTIVIVPARDPSDAASGEEARP